MALYKQKWFWFVLILTIVCFSGLFWFQFYRGTLFFQTVQAPQPGKGADILYNETWKHIFIKDEKSGYAVSRVRQTQTGYAVQETASLRFNAMGMIQTVDMETRSVLKHDFSLESFDFSIRSGLFDFKAVGVVDGAFLKVSTTGADPVEHQYEIRLNTPPYLAAGILLDLSVKNPETGTRLPYSLFDPVTLQFLPATALITGFENIHVAGVPTRAMAVDLSFKNMTQRIWMDAKGRVLLETGMLGMRLEAGTKEQVLSGIVQTPRHDMTRMAAVTPDKSIENQTALNELVIELSGIDLSAYPLENHRQILDGRRLTIRKESLSPDAAQPVPPDLDLFLSPGPFVQSDAPEIMDLARSIINDETDDLQKIRKLTAWVYKHIDKQPSPSIPDALSTLAIRKGDCNEHAVLLAALGRAAGIPTRIETGLTYLDGRFMYHAWNAFYIGHWVTADAVFNQIPADVTHVGISTSKNGTGIALAGIIGNINITIIDTK
jgi:hypothetical protein